MVPYITEKTINLAKQGVYTLLGSHSAEKLSAKKMCEKLFNVQAVSVKSVRQRPKMRRVRNKIGQCPSRKKILIRLTRGQKIPGFEASGEKGQPTNVDKNS